MLRISLCEPRWRAYPQREAIYPRFAVDAQEQLNRHAEVVGVVRPVPVVSGPDRERCLMTGRIFGAASVTSTACRPSLGDASP